MDKKPLTTAQKKSVGQKTKQQKQSGSPQKHLQKSATVQKTTAKPAEQQPAKKQTLIVKKAVPAPAPVKKTEEIKAVEQPKKEKPKKEKVPLRQRWEDFQNRLHNTKRKKNELVDVPRFNADVNEGLSPAQVDMRMEQGLYNKAGKKYSKSYKSIFVGNICTFFNFLCVVMAIALATAHAPISQFSFVLIFSINIMVSIIQEIRAKRKIDKLAILSSPTAKVIRGGEKKEIPIKDIVLDDILLLSAGQQIPADCIAIEGSAEINESLLTGESVPIKKEDGDLLYAGSFVASGKIAVRIDKIGEQTYISKLTARAKKYKRPNSEIMNSITLFIKIIGIAIVPIAIFMFINNYKNLGGSWDLIQDMGGFFPALFSGDLTMAETIRKTVAVVVGMIPSGLLLLTTIALSVGMIKLAKYNTLVQDMYSLEMLARVNVLCLDKTGTITDGRMRVSDCILLNNNTGFNIDDILGSMLASLDDNNQTSIALYERFGHSSALQPTATLPFSSARKLSAVTFGEVGTFALGAPEFVLRPMPLRVEKIVKQYAQMGLRVMVVAHSNAPIQNGKAPTAFRPIAILTLSDNIRPDAIETIKWFKENDVDVKVISGHIPVTVAEVARRAGIKNASHYLSLEGLSDLEVENAANQYTVFGRVTPEQKAILIRSIKKAGNTVAMTGDGVNDILAMKEADCAVSVASGSDAARNVSNLVLQDNNFSSMPKIVNEGRRVINNIKDSASLYIMKTLLTLILAVVCIVTGSPYFFETNNMMMYEIFISAIPSFVLSLQPNTKRVKGKFIPFVISRAIPGALTMVIGILALYVLSLTGAGESFGFIAADGGTTPVYSAMLMISLTLTGCVMLFRICQPLNAIRAALVVVAVGLCAAVLAVPFLGEVVFEGWSALHFTLPQILLIVIIVQAAIPISEMLLRFFDLFNPADN